MKKVLLLTLLFALFTTLSFAQSGKYWSENTQSKTSIVTDKAVARLAYPKEFKLFNLDIAPLRQELFAVTDVHSSRSAIISLPNADGQIEQFEVFEASNFVPELQARFPEIRAFSGRGITDRSASLKLSLSPLGIQTTVFRADKATEFMEPYSQDHNVYSVYKSQRNKGQIPWVCSTPEQEFVSGLNNQVATHRPESSAGQLKTMRLAQSVTAEYSNYWGATSSAQVALVLAGVNLTMTRCNGVYEKDLAVHLNLIANTTDVFYYNPATDPYSPAAAGAAGAWNGELQNTLTTVIGDANYDIGHLFGASGGGGNAGCIGCVCVNGSKGSGFTSPADAIPQGDNFDIDYVVHEVGHQLGGNHTFSHSNQNNPVQKEVGSGITIMGYAGITSFDAAAHSIDIYHEASIDQIQVNLAGKTCPVTVAMPPNNATPVVAPVPNYTIPISTPFALTGSATDADPNDVLTYCWEQNDLATTFGANSVASPTKATGPNWLSFLPTTSPTRIFPRLATILAGNLVTGPTAGGTINIEALSSISRTLNFRLTVRDNCPYVPGVKAGQTSYTDMVVTVTNTSGPFQVTQPNTNLSWPASSQQTVTWNVASTTGAPVSCANVKITLSTDGGQTFPYVLAASTANDGTELITLPAVAATTTARVKVEAVGNIFFDISNTNFTITAAVSGFTFNTTTAATIACNGPSSADITLGTTANGGFSTPIVLTASGVPAGTSITFTPNPVTPGSSVTVTLEDANTLSNGTYNITITGTAGSVIQTTTLTYIVSAGAGPSITTQPASTTVCSGSPANFTVVATDAISYQWQVNTGTGFNNIAGATSATYSIAATTAVQNGYTYQCIVIGQCGSTTTSVATLTVNTSPAITTQPANAVACAGTNATFTVAATGSGLTYQWQSTAAGSGCGGTWTDIPGANANSYTVSGITAGMDNTGYRVIVSGSCTPAVTSNCATLTVGNAAAITTQPADLTVCVGDNAVFSVVGSGSISSYQWQVNTGTGFTDIPGANAATLTLNAVTATLNGYQYRVNVFSCTATPITSNSATLTVNTPVSIGTQPAASTLCLGGNTSFTVAATGTGLSYQWQYAATCGGTFTNIAGATSATLSLNSVALSNAGAYQVVITGACNTVTSSCVTLTVNSPITISAQPADVELCLPTNAASFSVSAAGTGLTYQWQVSTNGGTSWTNLAGETSATLNLTGITAAFNGNQYRVVLNGTCTTDLNSSAATLVVNSPVDITDQPDSINVCSGNTVTFHVEATGSTITYQWQVSVNGAAFVDLANSAPYSGVTTNTLTVGPLTTSMSGYLYRVIVSGVPCGSVISDTAQLVVNITPVVVLKLASYSNINPGIRTTLYTTVSPALTAPNAYVYQWYKDGVLVPSITGDRYEVTPDDFGSYEVVATDTSTTSDCSSRSNAETVAVDISDKLFIYPNPNTGSFQVRYYSSSTNVSRTLNIYDSKGARVYSKAYAITAPYTRMSVNLDNASSDIYMVELRDGNGKRLAAGKVVIK